MPQRVIALILGGGQGTRLSPLTESRSKPAVPIAGKYRLVDIPISNCLNSDIRRIFVLTQFNSASLNKHIKNTYNFDHFNTGFVDILAAEQTPSSTSWFQGTADAVRQCLHHLETHEFQYVLILSGDQLYQMNFNDMLSAHISKGASVTIATIPVNSHDATSFGIMKTNEEETITSFIEKPKADVLHDWTSPVSEEMKKKGRNYLASMGIYIFNRKFLIDVLRSKGEAVDFGKEIIPQAIEHEYKVVSFPFEGYWTDIGNIASFFEANLELTEGIPQFNLFNHDYAIYTHARMLPPSKISGTTLERTLIADGCIIMASRLERAVVGIRTRIGIGTTISNSYIMGSDNYQTLDEINETISRGIPPIGIGERCYINNAILDRNCRIGNDVRINGGSHLEDTNHELYVVKSGIVVIKKNAVIPHGFTI
ncbi:MAG: glucose-1-phosphate adenylyltransferase [Chitinophagaceae bacterium]|jgi:glucose-1-phosphate adenylyltransferase|nr:MAG: glucose-1-phosphate adenylyltransferase [Chitinophagaceae bacterium]